MPQQLLRDRNFYRKNRSVLEAFRSSFIQRDSDFEPGEKIRGEMCTASGAENWTVFDSYNERAMRDRIPRLVIGQDDAALLKTFSCHDRSRSPLLFRDSAMLLARVLLEAQRNRGSRNRAIVINATLLQLSLGLGSASEQPQNQ